MPEPLLMKLENIPEDFKTWSHNARMGWIWCEVQRLGVYVNQIVGYEFTKMTVLLPLITSNSYICSTRNSKCEH